MHITITGKLGSGKSTISSILNEKHSLEVYSTGKIQRQLALELGISTLEMNSVMSGDSKYDHMIDERVREISLERADETIVFDSRMAWHFAVNSFRVFVTADPRIAAKRVVATPRGQEEQYSDIENAQENLHMRSIAENLRFKQIYDVDNFDYRNYDLVIDSSYETPDTLSDIIYKEFLYISENKESKILLISPKSLYPTTDIKKISNDALNEYIMDIAEDRPIVPVSIAVLNGYHFVLDGHHRVLASLMRAQSFVNCKLADKSDSLLLDNEENMLNQLKAIGLGTLKDYEAKVNFKYASYPAEYI